MAGDVIRLRAGSREGMPRLADREPAYVRDEAALYIGTPEGNVKVADVAHEGRLQTLEQQKLTAVPAAALPPLPADAAPAAVAETVNRLLTAMQTAGLMQRG